MRPSHCDARLEQKIWCLKVGVAFLGLGLHLKQICESQIPCLENGLNNINHVQSERYGED